MEKGDYLKVILRSAKTVFTQKDISLLWGEKASEATKERLHYYVQRGDLYRVRRGIYAKNDQYNRLELATRIYTPAYVSFETVLAASGLIFQYYSQIFVASYLARELTVQGQAYVFRRIKEMVLINPTGVEQRDESSFATKERAFLDTLYLHADYQFDHLDSINWEDVFQILPIYENQRMMRKVQELYKDTTRDNYHETEHSNP